MANRNFNARQALEKEVKELYCEFTPGTAEVQATATVDVTTDITLTSVAAGASRNDTTFQLVVVAAAANPTDTVLVAFTGTAAAIVCTVTPNDGTNNGATPVDLDEDELVELINTGAVAGKTITLTDASSLRALQTATGGASSDALTSGDDQTVTYAGGVTNVDPTFVSGVGFSSIVRDQPGVYTLTLDDNYSSLKYARAIYKYTTAADHRWQVLAEDVDGDKTVQIARTAGASFNGVNPLGRVLVKLELKNTSAV